MVRGLAALALLSFVGWQMGEAQGPGSRPQYVEGAPEVRQRVNELIGVAEQACLATGTIDGDEWKRQRRDILGEKAGSVRVLCKQVKNRTDRVFVVQIGEASRSTTDGQRYFPAEQIPTPRNID